MAKRKSVAQILDEAATILETKGFTTSQCWDSQTGGYCALGAIARAAYPKASNRDIDNIAYAVAEDDWRLGSTPLSDRYLQAIEVATATIRRRKQLAPVMQTGTHFIYGYNDQHYLRPKLVVNMLRRAAQKAHDLGLDS